MLKVKVINNNTILILNENEIYTKKMNELYPIFNRWVYNIPFSFIYQDQNNQKYYADILILLILNMFLASKSTCFGFYS